MGTHGKTGLAHVFGGSKAEDVANRSNIPVLTLKIESPFNKSFQSNSEKAVLN